MSISDILPAELSGGSRWMRVLLASLLLTALNSLKPVHEDDPPYLTYSAEFAAHPLSPYAFAYGTPYVLPANVLLIPPVLPYWIGAGTLLLGDDPVVLKWWLFPFALLLAWAIDALVRRTTTSLQRPLFWLCLFSPTILPGFNFMLDIPMLALGLSAVVVGMRSVERGSWSHSLLAGLLAGLAIQTKYNGITLCAAAILWCVLKGRPSRGVIIGAIALLVVVGWECLLIRLQGESHFMIHLGQRQGRFLSRCLHLVLPLFTHVGGLMPAVALLGLLALGWSGRRVLMVGMGMLGCFVLMAIIPSQSALITGSNGKPMLTPSNLIYGVLGLVVWFSLFGVLRGLPRRASNAVGEDRPLDWFLLGWLLLELGGYFVLSPFPAARRTMGIVLACTIIVGRFADQRRVDVRLVRRVGVCGVALAMLIFVSDLFDARAARTAAREVSQSWSPPEGGKFWHVSWCGFSYYADREGLLPLRMNQKMPRPGDLLALLDVRELREMMVKFPEIVLKPIDSLVVRDRFPLRTVEGYYSGRTPLESQGDGRLKILIYQITDVGPSIFTSKADLKLDSR